MEELKRTKLDTAGPPTKEEVPIKPFGVFKKPTVTTIVGLRAEQFTDKERETNELVILTSDIARENAEKEDSYPNDSVGHTGTGSSNFSTSIAGSTLSLQTSIASSCSIEITRL